MTDTHQYQPEDAHHTHLRRLAEIGIALSAEKNIDLLLEKILSEARILTHADAGTLYLVNEETGNLEFAIVQNDTMKVCMGGTAGPITWPPVLTIREGKKNFSNVSSYAAIRGEIVNIPDVYEAEGFDFTGTRMFDAKTGYRSTSMLVIPMKNKDNETIGVLQLINALDPSRKKVVPFESVIEASVASLASQAAVAITNVKLYRDLENLFDSFIKVIASAIDEKSPYTGGHIQRVQHLTMDIARSLNEVNDGAFADFHLGNEEMKELSIAAWLHDIGKITTPEHILDKSTKLEKIMDRAELIAARFEIFKRDVLVRALTGELSGSRGSVNQETSAHTGFSEDDTLIRILERQGIKEEYDTLEEENRFIRECNKPGEFIDDAKLGKINAIASKTWKDGELEIPYLTPDETYNLSIGKGTLTSEERKIIENHAFVTYKMLSGLPFPKKMKNVPLYAASHHERLDGKGYPFGKTAGELPIQARIIAVADIFEALTAPDRPYRKPMPVSQALRILNSMKEQGHLDGDIVDIFIGRKIYHSYARSELKPDQCDC